MSLRDDIANLLRSPQCQRISFELRGVLVSGQLFNRVADLFMDTSRPYPIRIDTNPARLWNPRTGRRSRGGIDRTSTPCY